MHTTLQGRLTQLREMPVEQLYNHLLQRSDNERAGTGSPLLLRAMHTVALERLDEMVESEKAREIERRRIIEEDRIVQRQDDDEAEEREAAR
tara:strand:+ start:131 stop:406 length:276 start_codon:yes stop_codon:yes gene_type:complete